MTVVMNTLTVFFSLVTGLMNRPAGNGRESRSPIRTQTQTDVLLTAMQIDHAKEELPLHSMAHPTLHLSPPTTSPLMAIYEL